MFKTQMELGDLVCLMTSQNSVQKLFFFLADEQIFSFLTFAYSSKTLEASRDRLCPCK